MKKLLALLLAVAIVMTMSIPAFAEEVDEPVDDHSGSETDVDASTEIGVYGNYLDKLDADKILSVVVSWTDMYFRYAATQQGTWNPKEHTYDNSKDEGEWLNDSATITIANHSNTGVIASLGYTAKAEGVSGTLSNSSVELATAEGTDKDAAPSETVNFTISGTPSGNLSDGAMEWGTINVTLSARESGTSVLDLSGSELSEWAALISAYLDEHPGELTIKLGVDSINYVGDSYGQVDSANMPAHVLNNAVYSYNGNSSGNKVALTLVDVKTIGDKAFIYAAGCFSSISAPNATSIGYQAFQGNGSITTFNFPNVTSIGYSAFDYCGAMESITFGKVLTSVSTSAFGSSEDSDFYGKNCHSENVTITLNPAQEDYYNGYTTKWGENGTFNGYTWKNVVKG